MLTWTHHKKICEGPAHLLVTWCNNVDSNWPMPPVNHKPTTWLIITWVSSRGRWWTVSDYLGTWSHAWMKLSNDSSRGLKTLNFTLGKIASVTFTAQPELERVTFGCRGRVGARETRGGAVTNVHELTSSSVTVSHQEEVSPPAPALSTGARRASLWSWLPSVTLGLSPVPWWSWRPRPKRKRSTLFSRRWKCFELATPSWASSCGASITRWVSWS